MSGPHVDWLRNHDPLLRAARELISAGHASEQEILAQDEAARARIAAAATDAMESPFPSPSTVTSHVFHSARSG